MKTLAEVAQPRAAGERRFKLKHMTTPAIGDRNGNDDTMFKATNVRTIERFSERHGYDRGQDKLQYEQVDLSKLFEQAAAAFNKTEHYAKVKHTNHIFTVASRLKDHVVAEAARKRLGELAKERVQHMGEQFAEFELFEGEYLAAQVKAGNQLDELSKATLGRYVAKSVDSKVHQAMGVQRARTDRDQAYSLANSSTLNHSEAGKLRDMVSKRTHAQETDASNIFMKRSMGIDRALKKLTKEDINEDIEHADAYAKYHDRAKELAHGIIDGLDKHATQTMTRKVYDEKKKAITKQVDPSYAGPSSISVIRHLLSRIEGIHGDMKRDYVFEDVAPRKLVEGQQSAAAEYHSYHSHAKDLISCIAKGIDRHRGKALERTKIHPTDPSQDKKVADQKNIHWGHVSDIRSYVERLRDVHDALHQAGPHYGQEAPAPMSAMTSPGRY